MIDIEAEKVKNRQLLPYTLLPESGKLIEPYLANAPVLVRARLALALSRPARRPRRSPLPVGVPRQAGAPVRGARITCHQFRHLTAELYLTEDPNGIGVVGQHLGHKSLNTTRRLFAREQTRIATQPYHEVLTRRRARASSAPRTRDRAAAVGDPR